MIEVVVVAKLLLTRCSLKYLEVTVGSNRNVNKTLLSLLEN